MSGRPTGKPLRLLLVEDRETDALLLLDELRSAGYDTLAKRVDEHDAMAAALAGGSWDLIISDFSLPRFSGRAALALRNELGIDVPFLIVSGSIDEADAVDSLRNGADDFINKGHLARLCPAIERGLRDAEERRARRMAEARLRQAQKMEAIGQLAGGVAHDFNNLLGVILGYTELMLKDSPGESLQHRRLEQTLRAAERGAALTRQLLTFSRQQAFAARPLDLSLAVGGMLEMLTRLIGENVEIVTLLGKDLYAVKADPLEVEQVLLNLSVNARDAMPDGGRLIIETRNADIDDSYVHSHPDASLGPHVLLAVSDTGHGMDSATLARLFEPFFTTKEAGRGTGLGLATVYGIVRKSRGHIGVYSEPGHGTTFKVYLPRTDDDPVVTAPRPTPDVRPARSETVLLLEDETPLRAVIHELLVQGGYKVIDGSTPDEALAAAENHSGPIDLMLTDLVMPRFNGLQAAERIRAARPATKVLFMSGYTSAAAGSHVSLPEGCPFIQKPFGLEALLKKVREVLDSRI